MGVGGIREAGLHCARTWICSWVHWSRFTDFTLDICTPRFLWIPAHRMQINTPMFQEAHRGPMKMETGQSSTNYENVPAHLCYWDYQATFLLKSNERDFTAITFILTLFIPMDQCLIFSLNGLQSCAVTTSLIPEQFDHSSPKPTSRHSEPLPSHP